MQANAKGKSTMDLSKSYEFFQPEMLKEKIHIIGCGSVGSTVAENLARFGVNDMVLYDFDFVEPHNLANQMFTQEDIARPKVEALADYLKKINPDINLKLVPQGWAGQRLAGYVFLCVDSIELRKEIATKNYRNNYIKAMFDFRTRLLDAQHYAADWSDTKSKDNFIASMDFTHEEAMEETPVSACRVTLSVSPTIRVIVALGVSNFINFVKDNTLKKMIQADPFNYVLDAF